jgi:uroporphyrinogen decarboxylase
MRGGIDKHVLFQGRDAIRRELERVAPVVQDGGYIPMIDHSIPIGVPFADYAYFIEMKSHILGMASA